MRSSVLVLHTADVWNGVCCVELRFSCRGGLQIPHREHSRSDFPHHKAEPRPAQAEWSPVPWSPVPWLAVGLHRLVWMEWPCEGLGFQGCGRLDLSVLPVVIFCDTCVEMGEGLSMAGGDCQLEYDAAAVDQLTVNVCIIFTRIGR